MIASTAALARPAPGEEERARGVLAEARREERGCGKPLDDEILDLIGWHEDRVERDVVDRLRQPDDDAVVAPNRGGREVETLEPFLDRHRPRRVHP